MFDSHTGDVDIQQRNLSNSGCLVVSSGVANSGVIGRSNLAARVISGNTITVDMFGNVFARDYEYKMVTHARVFSLEFRGGYISSYSVLYISTLLKHLSKVYSYNNMASFKKIANLTIRLPVIDAHSCKIDFAYMESFIRELESARVRELEKWLVASGLDNYRLTAKEQRVLEDLQSGSVRSATFKIRDLFELKKGKRLTKADMESGSINFIGATAENNGVTAHVSNSEHLHSPNTITVSYNGSVGEAFYQADQFWASDDINVFYPKFRMEEFSALYLISLIKQQGKKYSYSNKWTKEEMEETVLLVPVTPSGSPDIDFMEHFIHAIIKQVIRGVVEWKDWEIAATKKAIATIACDYSVMEASGDGCAARTTEKFLDAAGLPVCKGDDEYAMPPEEPLM